MINWNSIDGMLERLNLHMSIINFNGDDNVVFQYKIKKSSNKDIRKFDTEYDLLKYLQRMERKLKLERIKDV